MEIRTITKNGKIIAIVDHEEVLIHDEKDALNLLAAVQFDTGSHRMVLKKSAISDQFFDLSTKLAGSVLQKFINYHMKVAVVGDFSDHGSESLQAFIRESNQGKDIFFVKDEEEAVERLSQAL